MKDTITFLCVLLTIPGIEMKIYYKNMSSEDSQTSKSVITRIVDEYFKRDLHFLVVVSMNSTQPELFDDVLSHVHRNNSVPVVALENFTGRSTFNNKTDDDYEYEEEEETEEETETSFADNDYKFIDYSHEGPHDFTPVTRVDTIENSVGFIFFVREVTDHCFVDSDFTSSPFWNSRAFILLVITEPVEQEPETVVKMFQGCWDKHSILNLAVVCERNIPPRGGIHSMALLKDHITELQILTYNPFIAKSSFNIQHTSKNVIFDPFTTFPSKTLDVCGYPINVKDTNEHPLVLEKFDSKGQVYFEGPDGLVINTLLEWINASFSLIPPVRGERLLKMVTESSKNILGVSLATLRATLDKSTYPHEKLCLTAIVPKALPLPEYMNIILPFTSGSWAIYFLFAFIIFSIWIVLSRYDILDKDKHFVVSDVELETFRLLCSGSTERKPNYFVQRFFICVCLMYTLIINNAYQGSLTSYLTEKHFYHDINSAQDVMGTDIKIITFLTVEEWTTLSNEFNINEEVWNTLIERVVYIPNETKALEMIAVHRNYCSVAESLEGKTAIEKPYFYKNGYPMLHMLEECYLSLPVGFVALSKNNPVLSRLNILINRLSEGGFVSKWRKDYIRLSTISSKKLTIKQGPVVISLEHLQAPFFLLFIGSVVSFVVFIFDLVVQAKRGAVISTQGRVQCWQD